MKNRIIFTFPVLLVAALFYCFQLVENSSLKISEIRKKHTDFLKQKSPKKDQGLSRMARIKEGLPPNAYYELMEYLTMNPSLGYPEPYKARDIRKKLEAQRKNTQKANKAPGETEENKWVSRGPLNVGGRTRALIFDPNDATGKRVFAGAISGGLWVNADITREDSPWKQVTSLPSNLNISCITIDPRNSNTWYVGTGEQYTAGDVVGTGVYKSTDGGNSWIQVLDVERFSNPAMGSTSKVVGGVYYINDIVAWDNGNSTEVYLGVSTHIYANARNPLNFMGYYDRGLYRSIDGGTNWDLVLNDESFNDFETDANGNLWVVTTESPGQESSRGGKIFKKNKGEKTTFQFIYSVPGVFRTEIEASKTNPEKFYVLAENAETEEADLWITNDAFLTLEKLNEPADADYENISPNDFARGQAFYNLLIESDPEDDNIVYVGGIDLFRSTNGGGSWQQISRWHEEGTLKDLSISVVHADHHVMQFRPGNSNQAAFGHDGGVSYSSDLVKAENSEVIITPDRDYVTTQFYSVAVAPTSFNRGDFYLGGTQDNGSQLFQEQNRESLEILGGDGAQSFYDQVETNYLIANLVYNDLIIAFDYNQNGLTLIANNEDKEGFFINPQALDSNLDKLFSNGPEGILYRYDLTNLKTIGEELTDSDPVAPRTSFSHPSLNTSISALAVSPYTSNSSTVLLGLVNGKLLRLEKADGHSSEASWINLTGSQFVGSISDIEFGDNENEIFVTFYNYGVTSLWYTKNALDPNPTWVNKEGNLPDIPVLAVIRNPINVHEVILGTELGIWSTKNFLDEKPLWIQADNGMSDVKVTDIDLKKGSNVVFASTYGRGIFSGQFSTNTSKEGETSKERLSVFPTFSDGYYNILMTAGSGTAEILVFDLQGQLVQISNQEIAEKIPTQISLAEEASGIYFVKVEFSGETYIKKVVKK